MYKRIVSLMLLGGLVGTAAVAADGAGQAQSFADQYSSLCLKNAQNFEVLRTQLKTAPKLSPEKAAVYLSGKQGDVWPVKAAQGAVVLSLPNDQTGCSVHVKGVDARVTQKQFTRLVAKAPYPMVAKRVRADAPKASTSSGGVQTVAYEWSAPNSANKMLFTLRLDDAGQQAGQALGSVQILPNSY